MMVRMLAAVVPLALLLLLLLEAAPSSAALPPTPPQYANLTTTSIFWPNETAADGSVFACTYLPTLVLANDTRLIAHGRCYTARQAAMSTECGGFHVDVSGRLDAGLDAVSPVSGRLDADADADAAAPDLGPVNLCQKHSDDGGLTWSRIRSVGTGLTTGQVLCPQAPIAQWGKNRLCVLDRHHALPGRHSGDTSSQSQEICRAIV